MISFDLKCGTGHVFEAWFRSSGDYDDQLARGLIACPMCNDTHVAKAVMAPNVAAKGNRAASAMPMPAPMSQAETPTVPTALIPSANPGSMMAGHAPALPPQAVAMLAAIAQAQAEALPQSRWVGRRFADEARALHRAAQQADDAGEAATPSAIHGQATADEAEALADEGIAVMPLLIPIVPPEMQN